jgi:hypothetical protein
MNSAPTAHRNLRVFDPAVLQHQTHSTVRCNTYQLCVARAGPHTSPARQVRLKQVARLGAPVLRQRHVDFLDRLQVVGDFHAEDWRVEVEVERR